MSDYVKKRMEALGMTKQGNSNNQTAPVNTSPGGNDYVSKRMQTLGLDRMSSPKKSDTSVDIDYINRFIKDYQNYLKSASDDASKIKVGNSKAIWETRMNTARDLSTQADSIMEFLKQNTSSLDSKAFRDIKNHVEYFKRASSESLGHFRKADFLYSHFKTQDEYDKYVAQREDYEKKIKLDLGAAEKEISGLESVLQEYKNLTRWTTDAKGDQRAADIRQRYGGEDEIKALINEKRTYLNQARHVQEGAKLSSVSGNDDLL